MPFFGGRLHDPGGAAVEVELRAAVAVPHVLGEDLVSLRDLRAQGPARALGVHLRVDVADHVDLLRVVGVVRRTEEVVVPLRDRRVGELVVELVRPHRLVRLVCLVLPRHEPPAGAAHAVLREERIRREHVVALDARQPFRVHERTPPARAQRLDRLLLLLEVAIAVVANDVGKLARHLLRRRTSLGVSADHPPDVGRERLLRVDAPRDVEELPQVHDRQGRPVVVARLVPEVPEEHPVVVAVLREQLLAHPVELRGQLGVVKDGVAHRAGKRPVLRAPASAVVAHVVLLNARLRQRPDLLRARAVVAQHHDRAHPVLRHDGEHPLEARHEAVVLREPHAEPLLLHEDAQGVEADRFGERQLALDLREALLAPQLLPLVHAVRRARRHVVAAADPRLGVVPLPRPLLGPRRAARRKQVRRRQKHAEKRHLAQPHGKNVFYKFHN